MISKPAVALHEAIPPKGLEVTALIRLSVATGDTEGLSDFSEPLLIGYSIANAPIVIREASTRTVLQQNIPAEGTGFYLIRLRATFIANYLQYRLEKPTRLSKESRFAS